MKTTLRWYARLVDAKGAAQVGMAVELQAFDRTAGGWVTLGATTTSPTGLVRARAALQNDSPILAPALRLVEKGAAVVLSASPRLAVAEGGAALVADFGELTHLPEPLRFVPPRGTKARVPDDPFVVGALVGPAAAAAEVADTAAAQKALREQVQAEVTHTYEERLLKAQQDQSAAQAMADRHAAELQVAKAEIERLVKLPPGAAIAVGGPVKMSEFASVIGNEIGSAQQALKSSGYALGAISLTAKTLVENDGSVRFLGKDDLKGLSGRALSDLVLQFRPDDNAGAASALRVPDVRQLTESAARRILASVGLVLEAHLGSRDIEPASAPGQAMLQSPAAGQPAVPGARVLVVFAQETN